MKTQRPKPEIKLVLTDVDGTLVDSQKRITARAHEAIKKLREAGIGFAITSGRPPRGMKMVADAVTITAPIAAFNGGTLVRPDNFEIIESLTLPRDVAEKVIARIGEHGLDVWVYAGLEWYLRDLNAPHREKEEHTVQFPPTVVADFSAALEMGAAKIVGVSDDLALVERVEKIIQDEFAGEMHLKQSGVPNEHYSSGGATLQPSVSAARSQPYYLDVTHPRANKGGVVEMLVKTQGIPASTICTMGDMPNDVLMFDKSGFSIAMGQSSDAVKNAADRVSTGLNDEGFARGVEDFILGDK
ncbi:MAG TPA: Cof-type HAD-IIB family hydrolase [Chthoniobacterales bacterium]